MHALPRRQGGSSAEPLPRRKFSPDEDLRLRTLVDSLGTKSWEEIARFVPQRSARQCRDRYKNYLLESLMADPWTPEEDAIVIQQYHRIGPKWVEIGKMLNGRSGNNVKNRWHKHLCRLESSMAADSRPAECPLPPGIAAPARPPEAVEAPPPAYSLADFGWPPRMPSAEPFAVDRTWTSGFSIEDSLF
jgi:hypothetical protein